MTKFSKSFKNFRVFVKFENFNIYIIILKNYKTIIAYHFGQYFVLGQCIFIGLQYRVITLILYN